MRIGMMADIYWPHLSGVTNYIRLNKAQLESDGHQVFIFTFGEEEPDDGRENVTRSPGVPVAETGAYLAFRYTRAARQLLRTMDVVHVHHPFLSGRLAVRYCRPFGIPIAFTNHTRYDLYAQAYLPILPEQISTTFLQAYLPSFCRSVDLVIAPSRGVKRVLLELGVDVSIEVIPNGVDLRPFQGPIDPIPRQSLNIPPSDVLLVYAGRLAPEKNLTFLLRAVAGVQLAYGNIRLMLVGSGPERDNLEHIAASSGLGQRVIFTGQVGYSDLPRYLALSDAFVTASVTEVHPLSVIEALAAGLPVLGIDSPGVADLITDGENGYLCANDLAAYVAKLGRLVAEPERRLQMGRQASASAQAYAIESTSALVLEAYCRLVGLRRRGRLTAWRCAWQRLVDRAGGHERP
jgi:1,2-diacylglycerol 3-alpha-glucosyltransferase